MIAVDEGEVVRALTEDEQAQLAARAAFFTHEAADLLPPAQGAIEDWSLAAVEHPDGRAEFVLTGIVDGEQMVVRNLHCCAPGIGLAMSTGWRIWRLGQSAV